MSTATHDNGPNKLHIQHCGANGYSKFATDCMQQLVDHRGVGVFTYEFAADADKTGHFEVSVNGKLVHSKKETGKFIQNWADFFEKVDAACQ